MTYNYGEDWADYDENPNAALERKRQEESQIEAVIVVMEDWFQAIERGDADERFPDPAFPVPDEQEVERVISMIDEFCLREVRLNFDYWGSIGKKSTGKPIDLPPGFDRLTGVSRTAFVQALKIAKRHAFGF